MRVGIISDTHGSLASWQRALEVWGEVDYIIHAGDINYQGPKNPLPEGYDPMGLAQAINASPAPVLIARGNCDSDVEELVLEVPMANPYLFCQLGEWRILAHHGHIYPPDRLRELGERFQAHMVITGHTHKPFLEAEGGRLFINPGSAAYSGTIALLDEKKASLIDMSTGRILKTVSL